MTTQPKLRADILGKLLMIQETLDILPDNAGIAAFLRRALGEIPGVTDLHLCVRGTVFPPSEVFAEACARHEAAQDATGTHSSLLVGNVRTLCAPLRTARNRYGMLLFSLDDEAVFLPYQAFVQNIANVVAATFETREHIRQLDAARAGLEAQVAERTATLKESQEKFRALVETTSDWVWQVDANGTYVYASPRIEALLGFKPEEVVGKKPFDLMPPEERQRTALLFLAAIKARKPLEQLVNINLHKDGHVVVMETSGTPIIDARGNFAGYRGIDRDITARQRAEEALHESEEKFRQVSAGAQDAIIVLDQDGAITDWNAAAEKIFGYTVTEVIGKNLHVLIAPARQRDAINDGMQHFRNSGTGPVINKTLELAALRRDGTEFPVELSISSIQLRGHWHAIGIVRDISERKRTEREALKQFNLTEAFFNHSVSCLVILDRHFNFVRVNEAYARACRREVGEFAGRNHFEMYPSDAKPIFEDVIRTKRPFTTFTRAFTYPDQPERGTTYWDWTLAPILDQQGEVEYLVFSLQEVTERRRAEESQRAAALYARSLIEASLDPLVTIDPEGKIMDVNRGTEEVTGIPRTELIGTDFADYFTEPGQARTGYRQVLAQGYVRDYPLTIRHRDGRTTDVLYNATVYRNEHGKLQGVFAAARDITERKRADAMRTQLAAIVQSSNEAIIGEDLNGIISSWNPGAEKVYGFPAEEVIGRPGSALAPDDRKNEITQLLAAIRRGETIANFETERFRKDGRRIDITLDLSPIKDVSGRIVGVSTIARDITEKKQAERALRKVNRALKTLGGCNLALIHATEEVQFLNEICRVIVESEGYCLAWVGYVEHDLQQTVRPVAQHGYAPDAMERAVITWADNERGRGPLGIAIRTGQIQVVQDVKTDPRFVPWRDNAARLGYGSVLVLPLLVDSRVIGALNIYGEGANVFDEEEISLLGELAADMAFGVATLRTRSAQERSALRLQRSMEATIQAMADTVEIRDPYTAGHQRRVAELATAIAREMGLTEDQVRGVHLAGVVHDIGKIQIPAEILIKPGKLDKIEFELVKSHPEVGYKIIKDIDFPWPIAQIVYQHHEKLDGSGYPRGLKGDEILLEARILTVADVVEAMASHRPYRAALGIDQALEEISANAGKYYDAEVVRVCIALFRDKAFAFTR